MNTAAFKPWNGEYEKEHYDVLLPNGKVILYCWPNAGVMIETDFGKGCQDREFKPEDVLGVRVSNPQPFESGVEKLPLAQLPATLDLSQATPDQRELAKKALANGSVLIQH